MELVRYIAIDFGATLLATLALIAFLFSVRNVTLWLVRRWTAKKLEHYHAIGMEVQVTPFAVEHFAGTVAMCTYGLILTSMAGMIVFLGYQMQTDGLNPNMSVVWSLAIFGGLIGLSWVSTMGYSAYRRWSDSFLPLESGNLSIADK